MRQIYQAYSIEQIWPLLTAKLQTAENKMDIIWQSSTAKLRSTENAISQAVILCKEKHDSIVQYSIRNMHTPMGVTTFMNSCEPPAEIQQVLPDSDQLRRLI